jgi:hypothetical protein
MTTKTEGTHAVGFLVSEANGWRSREQIVIASGQNLVAGAVLGKVTSSGEYAAYDNAATDGSAGAAGILFDAVDASSAAKAGVAIVRDAEVNEAELVYDEDSDSTSDIAAAVVDLLALGILMR